MVPNSGTVSHKMTTKAYTAQLTLIIVGSLIIKLFFLWVTAHISPHYDEEAYISIARNLVAGHGFAQDLPHRTVVTSLYPPVYPAFLALQLSLFGGSIVAAKMFQIMVSTANVYIINRLGQAAWGSREGILAAAIFAFYPELIGYSHLLWSETLFIFWLTLGFYLLLRFEQTTGSPYLVGCALVWGLAILTREIALPFTVIIILSLIWISQDNLRKGTTLAAIFGIVTLAVVTPWTARNYVVWGHFVPVTTNRGLNLWLGNNRLQGGMVAVRGSFFKFSDNETEREKFAFAQAWTTIKNEQPWWFIKKLKHMLPILWASDSFVIRHLNFGWYGDVPPAVAKAIKWIVVAAYIAVVTLGVIGLLLPDRSQLKVLVILLFGYYSIVHVVLFALSRFRLPLTVFLILYSAYAVSQWKDILSMRRWRVVVAGSLIVLFMIMLFTYDGSSPFSALHK